jgi:hypothetical protein
MFSNFATQRKPGYQVAFIFIIVKELLWMHNNYKAENKMKSWQGNYHVQINCMICKLGIFQMIKHFLDYTIDHNALK